jgi:hypothetical protein
MRLGSTGNLPAPCGNLPHQTGRDSNTQIRRAATSPATCAFCPLPVAQPATVCRGWRGEKGEHPSSAPPPYVVRDERVPLLGTGRCDRNGNRLVLDIQVDKEDNLHVPALSADDCECDWVHRRAPGGPVWTCRKNELLGRRYGTL